MADLRARWNHNLHYHPLVLAAAPARCRTALDVGCGVGTLTRELATVSQNVLGIDRDPPSVELARAHGGDRIEYVLAEFLAYPFELSSFDLVASVAALHHMDTADALARMARLVRPGGTLVVVGLARARGGVDGVLSVAGAIATRAYQRVLRKRYWEHSAPQVWPPPLSYAEVRTAAMELLPAVKYCRHLLWRYSLIWRRPTVRA